VQQRLGGQVEQPQVLDVVAGDGQVGGDVVEQPGRPGVLPG
jgi:hypothetical protein